MATKKKENKTIRRRLWRAWVSTVISIALVLVLVGAAALLLLNAKAVSDYFKENVQVSVIMAGDASEAAVQAYQHELDSLPFIRSTAFISKEQGIREMADMLGEDFMDAFGSAPIPMSIDLSLEAEYVSRDSLAMIAGVLGASPLVEEVVYQESLVDSLNANLGKITTAAFVLIAVLLFISIVLIGNTVRLLEEHEDVRAYYQRKFRYIMVDEYQDTNNAQYRLTSVRQSVLQGTVAALLAIGILAGGLYLLDREFPGALRLFPREILLMVAGIVLLTGIVICAVSTVIVVGRLVDMDKEELYS